MNLEHLKPSRRPRHERSKRLRRHLPPEAAALLESMYASEPQLGSDGERHALNEITRFPKEAGLQLYDLHTRLKPELSIEIGLAYGFSTVYLLAAMKQGGVGRHVAIDPFQHSEFAGIGSRHAETLGLADRFVHLEERSVDALPRLQAEGARAQLIFIDGDHRFDGVIVDLYLASELCDVGGVIAFDDVQMPAVARALDFLRANRPDYEEEPVSAENLAVFHRVARDQRSWDHFVPF